MKFRDAIFIVTEEYTCPIYNVGEELRVQDMGLIVPEAKPACLMMAKEVIKATSQHQSFERFTQQGIEKSKFDCGGCSKGRIRFTFKKEKGYATLQMKLLAVAERREKMSHMDSYFGLLRRLTIFEPLTDDNIRDIFPLLLLREYGVNKVVLKEGDPGTDLFIVLDGEVAVISSEGQTLSTIAAGEIFGEMSLLSGEPVTSSIHTRAKTKLASLSIKDFKYILNRYPVLQVFFYRILVERAQANSLRAGTISSGMSGELAEINTVELFQLINSSGKTGRIDLFLDAGRAIVLFHDGELIKAEYNGLSGKDAVFSLLAKTSGHFTYTSGIPAEDEKLPVIGGFMGLIMEGLQKLDEEQAEAEDQ